MEDMKTKLTEMHTRLLLLLLSHLFKKHASLTQQYAGLQEGRVQRKIPRSIKL